MYGNPSRLYRYGDVIAHGHPPNFGHLLIIISNIANNGTYKIIVIVESLQS